MDRVVLFRYTADSSQATAETKKLDKSLNDVGKSGAAGAGQASAALSGYEKAAKSASQVTAQYEREILSARSQLAELSQRIVDAAERYGKKSAQVQALRTEYQRLSATTRGLVAEKAILAAEEKAEEAAVASTTSAWSRKTSMINTGQGILRGYDAALQGVIRSVGGIQLGWAVLISLGASLLPLLFNLGKAEKEKIEIDKEMVALDLARSDSQARVLRTNADLISSLRLLASEQSSYEKTTLELKNALTDLQEKGQRTRVMYGQLSEGTVMITANSQALQSETARLNTEIGKQENVLKPAVEALIEYRDKTGKSTQEILEFAKANHFSGEQIAFFRSQLQDTIPFVNQLTDALDKLRVPQFNLGATPQGIEQLEQAVLSGLTATFEKGIGGSTTKANDFNAQVRALAPTLRALDEALKRNSGNVAEYNRQLAELNPVVRNALETF
ncbi:MAG: hypothetical protein AB1631_29810, partial [Acidobacteriota bacterium]